MIPRDEDREMLPLHDVPAGAYADAIDGAEAEGAIVLGAVAEVAADPNLDLIGYTFPGEIRGKLYTLRVVGTTNWDPSYVVCEVVGYSNENSTIRKAAQLRASRALA